jgi:hypothetical protein
MKRITLFMLLLCGFTGWAQLTITGTVSDATGTPISFANVAERNTQNGTTTAVDGTYSITVAENAVLVFSFIGYQTTTVQVNGSTTINITLQEGDALDEVVITALGIKRQERELGYAVQTLDAEDIQEVKSVNLVETYKVNSWSHCDAWRYGCRFFF